MPGGKKVQDDKKSEVQQIKKDEVSDQKPNHETKIENVVQEEIIRVNGAELEQTEKPQQLEMSNEKEEYDLKPEEEQKLVSILTALQELASSRPPNRKTKTTRRKKLKETTTTTIQDQEPTTFHIEMVQKYPMFCEMFCKWYKLIDLQFDYDVLETCYHAISLVDIYLNAAKNICTKTDLTINSRVLHHFYSKAWVQMNRTGEKLGDNCMREIAEASKTIFQNKSIADQCTLCEQICTYIDQMITTEVENHERLHPSKTWTLF